MRHGRYRSPIQRAVLVTALACLCLAQSGCFLLRLLLWPTETVSAVGQAASANLVEGLTGGAEQLTTASESVANIDRILADHPDAANRESLMRLREQLSETTGDQRIAPDRRRPPQASHPRAIGGREGPRLVGSAGRSDIIDEYDRRAGAFPTESRYDFINTYRDNGGRSGRFKIEHPSRPGIQQRQPTGTPSVTPRRSLLEPPLSRMPMIRLDGRGHVQHSVEIHPGYVPQQRREQDPGPRLIDER